ncbi:MAG: TetR/AcrR family transcriptional regulator, partial [Nocardioides sp.]
MSTSPAPRNRTYYDGDLRSDLVAAAARAAADFGPGQVSMRDLARQLGVSHSAPKNHFRDKRALFTAVATEAHRRLLPRLRDAVGEPSSADLLAEDVLDRLVAAGRAYLSFAREESAWFAVMWEEDLQDRNDPELIATSADTFAVIIDLSGRLIAAGRVVGDAHSVATLVWSIVHGFADLSRSG